jgi:hypothetical protein
MSKESGIVMHKQNFIALENLSELLGGMQLIVVINNYNHIDELQR